MIYRSHYTHFVEELSDLTFFDVICQHSFAGIYSLEPDVVGYGVLPSRSVAMAMAVTIVWIVRFAGEGGSRNYASFL